jgi:hypothetical protein
MTQKAKYRVGPPVVAGDRTVYLIGKVEQHLGAGYVYANNSPLGLLVLEGDDVFFSSFDPGFAPADILPLLEELRIQGITLTQERTQSPGKRKEELQKTS